MDWREGMRMRLPWNRGEIGGGYGGGSEEGGLHAPPVSNLNIAEHRDDRGMEKRKRGRPRKYAPPPPPPRDGPEKPRRGRPPGTGWRQKLAARLHMWENVVDPLLPPNMTTGEKRGEYLVCAPTPPLPQPHHSHSHLAGSFFPRHGNKEDYVIVESDDDDIKIYKALPKNRTPTLDKRSGVHEVGDERSGEDENMIDAIKAKHGNIDEDCIMKSESVRKMSLVFICNVLKDLEKKSIEELEVASLENYYEVVRDLENLNINVKWLLQRLDEIKDAITSRDEAKGFSDEMTEWMKKLEEKRKEVERLANENRIFEGKVEWLNKSIIKETSKVEKFQNMALMDGLI